MNDVARILELPRRTWSSEQAKQLALELTDDLKTSRGNAQLRPAQAVALYEIATENGLLGALRVGAGKTLATLLAPTILGDSRPVLLLPASLIAKTERERALYAKDWQIARHMRIISYESLGRTQNAELLESWRPSLIVADECHRLKNTRAAVTRRVMRYMSEHPETRFIGVSGTIIKHSLKDYWHLLLWALKGKAPVPVKKEEMEAWADILDDPDPFASTRVFAAFAHEEKPTPRRCREVFRSRLIETPGVVVSQDEGGCTASLKVIGCDYDVNAATDANFSRLRNFAETPSGWACASPMEIWRHARELALGLHYEWTEQPPEAWLLTRKAWAKFVRTTIQYSQSYDSELHIIKSFEIDKALARRGREIYDAWAKERPTFEPVTRAVWHDDSALDACIAWDKSFGPGIIWTSHDFFAKELARRTGLPFYGAGGVDEKTGLSIESEKGGTSCIASIPANSTGRNLQAFSRSLVTAAPSGQDAWEQMLGRTHREGQQADEVEYYVMVGCRETIKSLYDATQAAGMVRDTIGTEQKLLNCDFDFPSFDFEEPYKAGARWDKEAEELA